MTLLESTKFYQLNNDIAIERDLTRELKMYKLD